MAGLAAGNGLRAPSPHLRGESWGDVKTERLS